MVQKKVYIIGPMNGLPDLNFPAFDEARDWFIARGWEVISPADIDRDRGNNEDNPPTYREALAIDLPYICQCNAVCLIDGWSMSKGAIPEIVLADLLQRESMEIYCRRSNEVYKLYGVTVTVSVDMANAMKELIF